MRICVDEFGASANSRIGRRHALVPMPTAIAAALHGIYNQRQGALRGQSGCQVFRRHDPGHM